MNKIGLLVIAFLSISCSNQLMEGYNKNWNKNTCHYENLSLGQDYQGGKIAYILQPGDPGYDPCKIHGLIAANIDNGFVPWSSDTNVVSNTKTVLGSGKENTRLILSIYPSGSAASSASAYQGGGYDDWFLPSQDELDKIYQNKNYLSNIQIEQHYWSSTETTGGSCDSTRAYMRYLSANILNCGTKTSSHYVRPVRYF